MATTNPFDLLGEDDTDDVSKLIAAQQQKIVKAPAAEVQPAQGKAAKLPSKPPPPAQAVRESKTEGPRGGGRGGGRGFGRGRGGGGFDRDSNNDRSFSSRGFSGGQGGTEESDGGRQFERRGEYGGPRPFRGSGGGGGGRSGGFSNGEAVDGERPRRTFERRSGTGRGNEFKREGAGRGNWGTQTDEVAQATEDVVVEGEKPVTDEPLAEEEAADVNKESPTAEAEEKEKEKKEAEAEDKEMTLEEYQKVLEEKRKALQALKTEERKVVIDKELASMQPLSNKKSNDEVFAKLGSDKEKRKEIAEKEERAKKSVSINEFLKPAEGERYSGGRGRGARGRGGPRGGGGSGGGSYTNRSYAEATPSIEDPGQFPTLGGK